MVLMASGIYAFNLHRDVTEEAENEVVYEPFEPEALYTPDGEGVIYTPTTPTEPEVIYTPTEIEEVPEPEVTSSNQEAISILLLGVDAFESTEEGLPDSIIVITISPENESTMIVSIPRDIRTEMVGLYFEDKINHAYAFGGTEMITNSIQNLLDIPIDYYVRVDMGGFKALVDVVGGIEVENNLEFTFRGTHFPKGIVQLNGENALKFSRMRMEDPRGDFGRQERQRLIISALINELTSFSNIPQLSSILGIVRENVETNIAFNDVTSMLFGGYREAFENTEQIQLLVGEGQIINGIYYRILSDEEIANARSIFRAHLGLE